MKHIIPSAAFTLVGIMFSLFTATSTTSDLFRETKAETFLTFGLAFIAIYVIIVICILVRYYCSNLGEIWLFRQFDVASPSQDIGHYTSILLPIGVSLIIASGNATDPRFPWLDDAYDLATCLLIVPTFLLLCAAMCVYRRERIDRQAEGNPRDLPLE